MRGYLPFDPFPALSASGPSLLISYDRALLPGYGWSFPVPDGGWNVGCGLFLPESRLRAKPAGRRASPDLRFLLTQFLAPALGAGRPGAPDAATLSSPRLEPRPADIDGFLDRWLGTLRGATLRTGFSGAHPVRGRVVVVGEALGLTLPLTGDGIGKAMQSGLIAARAIAGALGRPEAPPDLGEYARELEARTRATYEAYSAAQRWIRVPAVPDLIVRRAARSASLRRLVEEIIAEKTDPRTLLSTTGILRAFVPRSD